MSHSFLGLKKNELDTPCLVIDNHALKSNLDTMRQHAVTNNINLRPHCKTHKCSKLAQLQLNYGAIGISAAKIAEAEVLINKGVSGVLVTSPVVTSYKIARLISCLKQAPEIIVVADNEQNINDLNQAAASIQTRLNVLVDLDSGIGRTGVAFEKAVDFARKIHALPWLNLAGIQCYAGNLQHVHSYDVRRNQSLKVMQAASELVNEFRNQGLPCSILTGTGTGTYDIDVAATEVTEIQPGSYTVMDVEYSIIGSKTNKKSFTAFKPAMTLLTSVISSNRSEHVTVDAGTKSIYVDAINKPEIISHPGLIYEWGGFGDEHGKITASAKNRLPENGAVLELIVPHCDPTINLFDKFFITEHDRVIDVWEIDLRGKSQ